MRQPSASTTRRSERGQVVVEFLFIFPAFLLICLLVIEISLMWRDKHLLRLAAFEAGRALLTGKFADGIHTGSPSLCWREPGATPPPDVEDSAARNAAHWAAIKKVALASPGMLYFTSGLPGAAALQTKIDAAFAATGLNASQVGPLISYLGRLPVAYALSEIRCEYQPPASIVLLGQPAVEDANAAVAITVTFLRPPRTPFAGDVVWLVGLLGKAEEVMSRHGLSGILEFGIDPLFYNGLIVRSPALATAASQVADVQARLTDIVGGIRDISQEIGGLSSHVQELTNGLGDMPWPGGHGITSADLKGVTDPIAAATQNLAASAANVDGAAAQAQVAIDDAAQAAQGAISTARRGLDHVANVATAVVRAYPSQFKLVEMTATTRLVVPGNHVMNVTKKWKGNFKFLGELNNEDRAGSTPQKKIWREWAHGLASTPYTHATLPHFELDPL